MEGRVEVVSFDVDQPEVGTRPWENVALGLAAFTLVLIIFVVLSKILF